MNGALRVPFSAAEVLARLQRSIERQEVGHGVQLQPRSDGFRLVVEGDDDQPTCIVDAYVVSRGARTSVTLGPAKVPPAMRWIVAGTTVLSAAISTAIIASQWKEDGLSALWIPLLVTLMVPTVGWLVTESSQHRAAERAAHLLSIALGPEAPRDR